MLLSGEIQEARAIGQELCGIAQRVDTGMLYVALDAMAYLACAEERCDAAARIAACADAANEAHGQSERRPAESQMRARVTALLEDRLGVDWREHAGKGSEALNEPTACALALGLWA